MAGNDLLYTELCFSQTDSNYWVYNGRSDLSEMTDSRAERIVRMYRDAGIEVSVLGVFTNLMEPDDAEREANLKYFERMIQIASHTGIPTVATECGFIPGRRGINADTYEQDFDRLKQGLSRLVDYCARYTVDVALEACVLDVVPSAKRARDLIAQVGSSRLKILLDPANYIANSSEYDMFRYLGPHIAYLHGKDRKVNDQKGRVVGDGDIDWPLFMRLYHEHAQDKPVIMEYVNKDNAAMVRDRLIAAARVAQLNSAGNGRQEEIV
ncbi:MAG: sugar phosphate isomerase/epimerase [Spirochaetaceae bacterium]|nr:MAG: sugar phosphate isomerase/epimerase [Spirochaetaceae bacterium]